MTYGLAGEAQQKLPTGTLVTIMPNGLPAGTRGYRTVHFIRLSETLPSFFRRQDSCADFVTVGLRPTVGLGPSEPP